MSEATKAALDAAIRAHIADEYEGSLTSSWVTICERIPLEGDDEYTHVVDILPEGQSSMTTLGLTHFTTQMRSGGMRND